MGVVLAVVTAVVAASCGDASNDASSTAESIVASTLESEEPNPVDTSARDADDETAGEDPLVSIESILAVAFAITDRLGGEPGFVAVVAALDRGYTLDQLLSASRDLGPDGWIAADDDGRLEPADSPLGLLGPAPVVEEESLGLSQPAGFRSAAAQQSDEEQYVAFVGETLEEIWARVEGRVKWGLPGEQVDQIVDDVLARRQIDLEFDALFEKTEQGEDPVDDNSAVPVALTLALVSQGYPTDEAIAAALLGTWEGRDHCVVIPGVEPTTALRIQACTAAFDATSDTAPTAQDPAPALESADGAWIGTGSASSATDSRSTTWSASAAVELRDGVFTLSFERASDSTELGHSSCSTTTSAFGQIDATPDEFGRVVFTSEVSTDIVSDCPFYESKGGGATETNETSFVGRLRDDNVFELENLVPGGETLEFVWTTV